MDQILQTALTQEYNVGVSGVVIKVIMLFRETIQLRMVLFEIQDMSVSLLEQM